MNPKLCHYVSKSNLCFSSNISEECEAKYYMVHQKSLNKLLNRCPNCGHVCESKEKSTSGSQLIVKFDCDKCPKEQKWLSQPMVEGHNQIPQGNLDLSASILFSGASSSRVIRVLKHAGVQTFTDQTYHSYQKQHLQPTVYHDWRNQQVTSFAEVRTSTVPLVLGGDGRSDSPGHSAKYGTYSMMDLNLNRVLDFKIVQV